MGMPDGSAFDEQARSLAETKELDDEANSI
jgi:hypothetical protein